MKTDTAAGIWWPVPCALRDATSASDRSKLNYLPLVPLGLEVLSEGRGGGDRLAGVLVLEGRGVAGVGHATGANVLRAGRLSSREIIKQGRA